MFARHGGVFVRVSRNRLITVGKEFSSRAENIIEEIGTRGRESEATPKESRNVLSE